MPWITLGQMRKNGGRMVEATCLACGHRDAVAVDSLPDEMPIPHVADKLRCSECQSKKINTKANLSGLAAGGAIVDRRQRQ